MTTLSLASLTYLGDWRNTASVYGIAKGVACDSRLLLPGQLFVALSGAHTDGHAYLEQAAAGGAVAAIVHKSYCGPAYGMQLLAVADPLAALQQLAARRLAEQGCRVVAITGSVGKTTTKDFLTTLLTGSYRVGSTPGNANSQIGLPLALLNNLLGDEEIVVCEMGMSVPGEISRLVALAPPQLAIITEVALAHAAAFDSLEAIAHAKGEILSHPHTTQALLNCSLPSYEALCRIGSCRKLSFSTAGQPADFQLYLDRENDLQIAVESQVIVTLPLLQLPGRHNRLNFLLAAIAAHLCGVSWSDIAARQPLLRLPERRLQYIEKNGVLFVNDAYNACLSSMTAALEALPLPAPGGRRIAALGAMLDLGTFSVSCHRTLAELALPRLDFLLCLGAECIPIEETWHAAGRPCILFTELKALSRALWSMVRPGDVVLLKGSRAKQMWKVIDDV